MAYFRSRDTIEKNSKIWEENLPTTSRGHKRNLPRIENLQNFVRLPLITDILGFYRTLFEDHQSKAVRIGIISKELIELWTKFSFPILSKQAISARISRLITEYEKNRKKPTESFTEKFDTVFDITKKNGQWLCTEDKKLYEKQIESLGKIGYTTHKVAPISSVHPSKRLAKKGNTIIQQYDIENEDSSSNSSTTTNSSETYGDISLKKKKKARLASKLVTEVSLSTNKAAKVCQTLADQGIELPTPSQSGIFKNVITFAKDQEQKLINLLSQGTEDYCLYFDGKRLSQGKHDREYQVLCLQNSKRELKLGVVRCESGSAENIFNGIVSIIDKYQAWSSIKMIVCDTTPDNTGHKRGVVFRIQQKMLEMGLNIPQYIGCQHHILDRILKHVLDFYLDKYTQGPNLNYNFIDEVTENYDDLKHSYTSEFEMPEMENPGWRNDFKFLYHLCFAFRQYKEHNKLPNIVWQSLPSLHSARWNSRAIYSIITYFLLPNWRKILEKPSHFIATGWQEVWFSNQKYNNETYDRLLSYVKETKCQAAVKCFKRHWSNENSVIDTTRSNIIAERAIKLMQELNATCKSDKYLHLKFISKNNL